MTVRLFYKAIKYFHKKGDWVVWLMRRLKFWTILGHSKLLEQKLLLCGEASGNKYNWSNNFHPFYIFTCVEYTEFFTIVKTIFWFWRILWDGVECLYSCLDKIVIWKVKLRTGFHSLASLPSVSEWLNEWASFVCC